MERGIVKWYDGVKGYGFITPDVGKKDIFVHSSNVNNLERALETGDRVEYEIGESPKGPQAKNVQLLQES